MRLLVTRPEEDAVAFKAQLIAQGHQVTIEPLLSVDLVRTENRPDVVVENLSSGARQ